MTANLWYSDDAIALRGPSPQQLTDCQAWCEANAESECTVRASALTSEHVRCGYDGVDQLCVLFAAPTLNATASPHRWAQPADCTLLNEEEMLCDDGGDDDWVRGAPRPMQSPACMPMRC